ncbi:hypothetical protein NDU88_002466 [Pleurodeles waltl]|uniref:Uncharacterized protein n=1 Tax=Pleurodeles waltl TaxID=8319 RepID=A0AAV7QCZ2_PLEWA|nr:hypothetical protein NDU88_002466 [Pleurodeles waltl]
MTALRCVLRGESFPPWRWRAWRCCWAGLEVAGGGRQGGVALAVRGSPVFLAWASWWGPLLGDLAVNCCRPDRAGGALLGRQQKGSISALQSGEVQMEDGPSVDSIKSMFMDLKSSLAGIDAKLDHLTEQMDRIRARVDEHDARFEQLESRTSEMEDQQNGERERLLQMERVLEVIRNKNEDLEARSRRNNVQLIGLPESTGLSTAKFLFSFFRTIF